MSILYIDKPFQREKKANLFWWSYNSLLNGSGNFVADICHLAVRGQNFKTKYFYAKWHLKPRYMYYIYFYQKIKFEATACPKILLTFLMLSSATEVVWGVNRGRSKIPAQGISLKFALDQSEGRITQFTYLRRRPPILDQSGTELGIQDEGAHAKESRSCWKTTHQPRRRTGIGLPDFHGNEDRTNR